MTEEDQQRWDTRYSKNRAPSTDAPGPPSSFVDLADHFPTQGNALDIACGAGASSVWLAMRGLAVFGLDISPVAIDQARALAAHRRVATTCRFEAVDLDDGLPPGPRVDLILCHLFRNERMYEPMIDRLAPGGLLAVTVLSEVGADPGTFRAPVGELVEEFSGLTVIAHDERDGTARLLARKRA